MRSLDKIGINKEREGKRYTQKTEGKKSRRKRKIICGMRRKSEVWAGHGPGDVIRAGERRAT